MMQFQIWYSALDFKFMVETIFVLIQCILLQYFASTFMVRSFQGFRDLLDATSLSDIANSQTFLNSITDDADTLAWFYEDVMGLMNERAKIVLKDVDYQLNWFLIFSAVTLTYGLKSIYDVYYCWIRRKKTPLFNIDTICNFLSCGCYGVWLYRDTFYYRKYNEYDFEEDYMYRIINYARDD